VLILPGCNTLGTLIGGGQPDFADSYPTEERIKEKIAWLEDQPAPADGRIKIVNGVVYLPYDLWQKILSDKVYLLSWIDSSREWGEKYVPVTVKKAFRRDLGTAGFTATILGAGALFLVK
jgi:hypothetical protein